MKNLLKNIDFTVLIAVVVLFIIGSTALYSASFYDEENNDFVKQIFWFSGSLIATITLIFINYKWVGKAAILLYPVGIVFLVLVLKTTSINGATSWFNLGGVLFQPSEVMKLIYILCLGQYLSFIKAKDEKYINKWWNLLLVLVIFAIPVLLILKQPDFGTAMTFIVITAAMLFISGLNPKFIFTILLIIVIAAYPVYKFVLNDVQKARIEVYLNPQVDPLGKGYNIIQSELAIGSGQLFGMGLTKGNQTQLGYIPIKTTDFIFSVISEEMGFAISGLLIITYVFLLRRIIYIAKTTRDNFGSLVAIGIAGMFFFHVLENIGMTMGLLPITGVPLPFVSYGGSSLLTNMVAIGIILSISARRQQVLFIPENM